MSAKPLMGAHVSVAGGLEKAFENAARIGAECVQFFGASPRQWAAALPGKETLERFHAARKESAVKAIYLHAPYLNNLASPDTETIAKTVKNMTAHLTIAEMIGAVGVVFHAGSGKADGVVARDASLKKAVEVVRQILKNVKGKAKLIIENVAGGGAKIPATPKEVAQMLDLLKKDAERVAVCYDTAHGFEAGLINEHTPEAVKALVDEWEREVGWEYIPVLHANDSKTKFNSHHDRHENIGEGYIGKEAFRHFATDTRLAHTQWILEVPGFDGMGPDKKNVDILRACRN